MTKAKGPREKDSKPLHKQVGEGALNKRSTLKMVVGNFTTAWEHVGPMEQNLVDRLKQPVQKLERTEANMRLFCAGESSQKPPKVEPVTGKQQS